MNKDKLEHYGCLTFLLLILVFSFVYIKFDNKGPQEFSQSIYYDNGNIKMSIKGKDGIGIVKRFYETGVLESMYTMKANNFYDCTKRKPIYHGPYKWYHENGVLAEEGVFENGKIQGQQLKYYKNGNIEYVVNKKDGKLNGEAKWYYVNGALGYIGNYRNDEGIGIHRTYTPELKLVIESNGKDEMWKGYFDGVILGVPKNFKNMICYAENKDIVDCKKAVSEFLMFFIKYQKAIYMINKN